MRNDDGGGGKLSKVSRRLTAGSYRVLVGDAAKIREAVAKYGPVTEMKISAPDFAPPKLP